MSGEDKGDETREVVGESSVDDTSPAQNSDQGTAVDPQTVTEATPGSNVDSQPDTVSQEKSTVGNEDKKKGKKKKKKSGNKNGKDVGKTASSLDDSGPSSGADVNDNDEEVDLGDLTQLTEDGRNILFGRGLVYERAGKKSCALKCYLACLSHLTPHSNFVLLPQCLRNIADLYYRKEQYEKAILFIQAEKLFYENALIDTNEVQQKIASLQQGLEQQEESPRSSEDAKLAADSLRADEYEHLAKLCVDKKQPQLALEYAGKATKLRQKLFGNDNPVTQDSLDFFATLYAEVGKQQYSDSMDHLSEPVEEGGETTLSPPVTPSSETSPSSILRQRKTGGDTDSERKKQVRFQEPEGTERSESTENTSDNEEFISHTLLWILLVICGALLGVLGLWLYCILTDSLACRWLSGELQYLYMRAKYFYYQYASTKKVKYT